MYTLTLHAQQRNLEGRGVESCTVCQGNATKRNPGTNHRDTRSAAGTRNLQSSRGTKLILHYIGQAAS
jgi:hypothetical protein